MHDPQTAAPSSLTVPAHSATAGTLLPVPLTPLINRGHEREQPVALLRESTVRRLTLSGPDGVGKTRLANAAGTALRDAFPDGMTSVGLAPTTEPGSAADAGLTPGRAGCGGC